MRILMYACTWREPRKFQTRDGPSTRQMFLVASIHDLLLFGSNGKAKGLGHKQLNGGWFGFGGVDGFAGFRIGKRRWWCTAPVGSTVTGGIVAEEDDDVVPGAVGEFGAPSKKRFGVLLASFDVEPVPLPPAAKAPALAERRNPSFLEPLPMRHVGAAPRPLSWHACRNRSAAPIPSELLFPTPSKTPTSMSRPNVGANHQFRLRFSGTAPSSHENGRCSRHSAPNDEMLQGPLAFLSPERRNLLFRQCLRCFRTIPSTGCSVGCGAVSLVDGPAPCLEDEQTTWNPSGSRTWTASGRIRKPKMGGVGTRWSNRVDSVVFRCYNRSTSYGDGPSIECCRLTERSILSCFAPRRCDAATVAVGVCR